MKTWKKGALAGAIWAITGIIIYFIVGLFAIGGPYAEEIAPILETLIFLPLMIASHLPFEVFSSPFDFISLLIGIAIHFGVWMIIWVFIFLVKENVLKK